MGDLQLLAIQPNGFVLEDGLLSPSSPPPLLSNPSPASISDDIWKIAELTTQGIIRHIQPTVVSEQRRKEVIEHVQGLLKGYLGCEVFPFGSVPLKTYLPDGDIDLTALSMQTVEEGLASDVRAVLEGEEQSKDADFEVKDVQYIHAEVKLVKCLVQNIVVDISFNQLGGICTLCFLEQVDRLIGKNHLFKRSIILIKSWCYYESRILGAHHGLISTYALETMVLYIFHLFHSSLNGPLAVLYRFLDYYSKFDWENFCISLNGPVSLSSLPEIIAETPDNDGGELLLDKDFLKHCVDVFSVPSKGFDAQPRSFLKKNLNIIDPLKENNNLGRSISRGNSYRIRSAFTYGARKLGEILLLRASDIADELNKFFTNTLDRHGSGQRPDVQVSMPTSSAMVSNLASSRLAVERCVGSKTLPKSASFGSSSTVGEHSLELQEGSGNTQISGLHRKSSVGGGKEPQRCATGLGSSLEILQRLGYIKENGFTGCPLIGDAENHATSRNPGPMVTVGTSESMPQSCESVTSPHGKGRDSPNLYLPPTFREHENIETRNLDKLTATSPAMHDNKMSSRVQGTDREMHTVLQKDNGAFKLGTNHKFGLCGNGLVTGGKMDAPYASTLLDPADSSAGNTGRFGVFNSLSDLSGDYDSHINSLICAQWCQDYTLSGSFMPMRPLPTQFLNNFCQPMHFRQNVFPHVNANGVFPGPRFFPLHPPMISGAAFGVEEFAKPRGTGTYLPNANEGSYKEWNSLGRRSAPPVPQANLVRPLCDNNWATTPETHFFENVGHAPRKEKFFSPAVHAKPPPPVFFQDNHPTSRGNSHTNGFIPPLEKVEFGTFGKLPSGLPSPDACRQPDSVKHCPGQFFSTPTVTTPEPIPDSGVNVEGEKEAYHLKNEADFPPLSARETSISK